MKNLSAMLRRKKTTWLRSVWTFRNGVWAGRLHVDGRALGFAAPLDEQTDTTSFGHLLGGAGALGYLVVAAIGCRIDVRSAYGQRDQGVEFTLSAPIFTDVATLGPMLRREQGLLKNIETGADGLAACLPITALEQNDEVVAADVADEVGHGIAMFDQQLTEHDDHVVASAKAIDVVVGLEVIQVRIGDDEFDPGCEQAFDLLLDRHVAGQSGKRVGISGGHDL
ncbi:MAG: hypothetical protein RMK60_11520 [Burkholderiales bacterium]|nr:hypothetical protein [Burkholderiales bacterium]